MVYMDYIKLNAIIQVFRMFRKRGHQKRPLYIDFSAKKNSNGREHRGSCWTMMVKTTWLGSTLIMRPANWI